MATCNINFLPLQLRSDKELCVPNARSGPRPMYKQEGHYPIFKQWEVQSMSLSQKLTQSNWKSSDWKARSDKSRRF